MSITLWLAKLALVCVMVCVGSTVAAAMAGRSIVKGTVIAFIHGQRDTSSIYLVDVNTRIVTTLTRGRGVYFALAWSPDGRRLLYVVNRDGADQMWVIDSDGRSARPVTALTSRNIPLLEPAWTRDGSRIVFIQMVSGRQNIYAVPPESLQPPRRLDTDDPEAQHYLDTVAIKRSGRDRSPNGAFTLSIEYSEGVWGIYSSEQAQLRLLHPISGLAAYTAYNRAPPSWSPDGRQVLFMDMINGALDLFVMDANGQRVRRLTTLGGVQSPVWRP